MRFQTKFLSMVILGVLISTGTFAETNTEMDLEQKLKDLQVPENELPKVADEEQLYAVQTRYAPLSEKHEIGAGYSRTFAGDSYLVSQQVSLNYRYHLNDHWSVGASGYYFFNGLGQNAKRLIKLEGVYPDMTYIRGMVDLPVTYNVFYGKFRLSMKKVLYFDQYVSLGPGYVSTSRGGSPALVGDIGFIFWLGKTSGIRLGLKDYLHQETFRTGSSLVHEVIGHLDVSMLLGGRS